MATQGAADGRGAKLGTLFGFKNGGPGRHGLVAGDKTRHLVVATVDSAPTEVTDAEGARVGELERGDEETVIRGPGGRELARVVGDPDGVATLDAFRMVVQSPTGEPLGRLQVVRTLAGWSLGRELLEDALWWGRAGQPLKLPVLGATLQLEREVDADLGDLLLAACVDLCIGLRPYVAEMR